LIYGSIRPESDLKQLKYNIMKTKLFLTAVSVFLLLIAFSSTNAQTDLTKLKHFKIDVVTSDDSLFVKVQKEIVIEPLMEKYVLIVNITSENKDNQRIVIGFENDPKAIMVSWNDISKEVRDGLIAWSKPNKTALKK
jgi:hypothetical protein